MVIVTRVAWRVDRAKVRIWGFVMHTKRQGLARIFAFALLAAFTVMMSAPRAKAGPAARIDDAVSLTLEQFFQDVPGSRDLVARSSGVLVFPTSDQSGIWFRRRVWRGRACPARQVGRILQYRFGVIRISDRRANAVRGDHIHDARCAGKLPGCGWLEGRRGRVRRPDQHRTWRFRRFGPAYVARSSASSWMRGG